MNNYWSEFFKAAIKAGAKTPHAQQQTKEETTMSKDNNIKYDNCEIVHEGDKIKLPYVPDGTPMSYDEGIYWLKAKKEDATKKVAVSVYFEADPVDAAINFVRALKKRFGFFELKDTESFFGKTPPRMISVPIGLTERAEILMGQMNVPGITGYLQVGLTNSDQGLAYYVAGEIAQKDKEIFTELTNDTYNLIKSNSIYKGKAIRISFDWQRDDRDFEFPGDCPKFIEVDEKLANTLIFSDKVMDALNIGLFAPIEYSQTCRDNKVPLKRGVLLYGPYGTGKTLTASITALKAIKNGWTFIHLDSVKDLAEGLKFASRYAPSVVFCEDIDRAVTGERSIEMDEILNILDGVDTKTSEIITVFTSNHIEKINPALLRMGRLDTVAEILPPDAAAAIRLVRQYAGELLDTTDNLYPVGEALSGKIPAMIREVVERSKIAAIYRNNGQSPAQGAIKAVDLIAAAHAMEHHNALLQPKKKVTAKPYITLTIPGTEDDLSDHDDYIQTHDVDSEESTDWN